MGGGPEWKKRAEEESRDAECLFISNPPTWHLSTVEVVMLADLSLTAELMRQKLGPKYIFSLFVDLRLNWNLDSQTLTSHIAETPTHPLISTSTDDSQAPSTHLGTLTLEITKPVLRALSGLNS